MAAWTSTFKNLLAFSVFLGLLKISGGLPSFSFLRTSSQESRINDGQKYETAIRNLTEETVQYTLRRVHQEGEAVTKSLPPGETDLWPCTASFDIFFETERGHTSACLECGTPYVFLNDWENGVLLSIGKRGPSGLADLAPYFPTPMIVVEKMLELAEIDRGDILYDLGSGDGRVVIAAAKRYGIRAIGIELDPGLVDESLDSARAAGVGGLVEFHLQDLKEADFSDATVVTLYFSLEDNNVLHPILEDQLKPGTIVVSHNSPIFAWKEEKVVYVTYQDGICDNHAIYVYRR